MSPPLLHNLPSMDALSTPVAASFKSAGGGGGASASLLLLPPSSPKASSITLLKASSLPLPSTTTLSFHSKPQPLHPQSRAKSHLHPSSVPKANAFVQSYTKFHHRAATGYAAALADAAYRAGTLAAADVDARRLVRRVRGLILDPTVKETEKVELVMQLIQSGGYEKHVVTLIRLLVRKGKLGLLNEVMAEFSRICDELSGTKVVVVGPSKSRGGTSEFERIAKQVQNTSGANRVKVRCQLQILLIVLLAQLKLILDGNSFGDNFLLE